MENQCSLGALVKDFGNLAAIVHLSIEKFVIKHIKMVLKNAMVVMRSRVEMVDLLEEGVEDTWEGGRNLTRSEGGRMKNKEHS